MHYPVHNFPFEGIIIANPERNECTSLQDIRLLMDLNINGADQTVDPCSLIYHCCSLSEKNYHSAYMYNVSLLLLVCGAEQTE